MATKQAGLGAALAVLVIVFGLIALVGVILLMMWFQPDIDHSPAQVVSTTTFRANAFIPAPEFLNREYIDYQASGVQT